MPFAGRRGSNPLSDTLSPAETPPVSICEMRAAIRELRAVVDLLARLAGPPLVPDGPVTIQLSFPNPNELEGPKIVPPLPGAEDPA